ncbi:MAG: nucleotide sugar dehydrogenase [Nitrospirae bacterium]|nr:nucleotide sugar dehydrogenase [Nitrospirota bacterium]
MILDQLLLRIRNREARIGVLGLGYVGLPLAVEYAEEGFAVTGFDVDREKIARIRGGRSYVQDVDSERLSVLVRSRKLKATMDFSGLAKLDAAIVCVPTPLSKTRDPDMSFILQAIGNIRDHLHKGQLVVLESTTYPGTTDEVALPVLAQSGLRVGRDFFLGFSPERIDPGNKSYGLRNTPKIVAGITPSCSRAVRALYETIVETVHPVSSTRAAEMTKLLENTFRAVNVGLVNEIAIMCNHLGLDTWEVIGAAATKPFGFMPFYPGPGLGGHCIPVDPQYLLWKLKTLNYSARFIELATEINTKMPEYVVEKVVDALNRRSKAVRGADILMLGVSYKKNIGDLRESPCLDILSLLLRKGARVSYHDPHVPKLGVGGHVLHSVPLNRARLGRADCVVIGTDHDAFDWNFVVRSARLVMDTRNATKSIPGRSKVVKL